MLFISEITRLLLEQNVDINASTEAGDSPLHGAMFGNKLEIAEMLIKAGTWISASKSIFDPM